MSDRLPRLPPGDPQNLLSIEARERINRVMIASEKFIWEAEIKIDKRKLDRDGDEAYSLRNEAHFQKAKTCLAAFWKEFSHIEIPLKRYWDCMRDEIESASNSLQLSDFQRRLLETEFFLPEERVLHAKPRKASSPPVIKKSQTSIATQIESLPSPKSPTVGPQINNLREECHLTVEELAEHIQMDTRSVQRHIASERIPYARHLRAYERVFSKLLNRHVVIKKMP